MIRSYPLLLLLPLIFLALPQHASAILPPDIIFNVGYQFVQLFSLFALVIGGVAGSLVIFLRPHLLLLRKHTFKIITILILLVGLTIGGVYHLQQSENSKAYLAQIETLREQLELATRVVTVQSTSTSAYASSTDPNATWDAVNDARRLFSGDTLYLYGDDGVMPLYMEIDLNRRQAPNGTFMHYYYLIGVLGGKDGNEYDFTYSTSSVPLLTKSIQGFERIPFSDHSTREEYNGTVTLAGTSLDFEIFGLQGDFITRSSQAYTRYQSVGNGVVKYNSKNISVHVLAEGIHSNDFSKSIFFEGADAVEATTRQFVLWDELGNFYMIDQSNVTSDTPEYTSHTWLLYKNKAQGYTKKGFTSDITAQSVFGQPETHWSITAPDFNSAVIDLSLVRYIDDGDSQTRMRALLKGTVTDGEGTRNISGFAFIIK